ncbi:PA14 domain-containing protein [Imperialibacter roseus]|uniref:PA14 domain-containing protein n=1 Tax=Imperialibacter roseus TaxID=1324217 RepID=A0ABZ0IX67_9BACT|nr:PA14 domain-containing protein [Imperialibacter roseus]WOK09589.1 PA14 domain-containing protein [Imperialibacter roseus]
MRILRYFTLAVLTAFFLTSCSDHSAEESASVEVPDALPMKLVSLSDLSGFTDIGKEWAIAGEVLAVPGGFEAKAGSGSLVKSGKDSGQISSGIKHADLELEFSFALSEEADLKVVLLEQYPLIVSEFANGQQTEKSGGGIPVRIDSTQRTTVNALKMPGLWQTLRITFKAPRFGSDGRKTKNAIFSEVYLNGFLIQSGVEVKESILSPDNEESASGSFIFTAANNSVALKDIKYKSFGLEKLTLSDLEYSLYQGTWDKLPDFTTMTPAKTGKVDELSIVGLADGNDHYGVIFKGNLSVPNSGDYLFETLIDDGGDLIIDGQVVVHNDGEPGFGAVKGLVTLEKGVHTFQSSYFQDVWSSMLMIYYEGPEISRQSFGVNPYGGSGRKQEPMVVKPETEPRLVRSFLEYKNTRKTHPISVVTSERVNYSYDLLNGALIKGWKGAYADASEMWRGRGEPQLLKPLNFSIDFSDQIPVARLVTPSDKWPLENPEGFKMLGYDINEQGYPVVRYEMNGLKFEDSTRPSSDLKGISREINFTNPDSNGLHWFQIASGENIYQLSNGWYCVDGSYYIIVDEKADANVTNRFDKELILQLPNAPEKSSLTYSIVW